VTGHRPEIGYWLGAKHWGKGYATEGGARADRPRVSPTSATRRCSPSVRVTNPGSRRVLEKCGFQWTGVGLCRIRALGSSVPVDRFRLERGIWTALKTGAR
jgi:RimJ/RimL family protein N-acetyltransferase